jgi:hypothetical protein
MDDKQLVRVIESAKDDFGVLNPVGIGYNLANLTFDDWKTASNLYAPNPSKPNDFFIEAKDDGAIRVHNNLEKARQFLEPATGQSDATGPGAIGQPDVQTANQSAPAKLLKDASRMSIEEALAAIHTNGLRMAARSDLKSAGDVFFAAPPNWSRHIVLQ